MLRRDFLIGLGTGVAAAATPVALRGQNRPLSQSVSNRSDLDSTKRRLYICVSDAADSSLHRLAQTLASGASQHPLMRVMSGTTTAVVQSSEQLLAGPPEARAYNHLILVGLPGDPLIRTAWQREALVEASGIYIFGFGHLRGDIGYIESDRNPFLHAAVIPTAPYETEVITLSGTTLSGVQLAAQAFRDKLLVNGVVAKTGWTRPRPSILDRDPLPIIFTLPQLAQPTMNGKELIGFTQASEDEYRGVLEDTAQMPLEIWRAKYFQAGAWDGAGSVTAFDSYAAGLHRRAYGQTLWMARFGSAVLARQAAQEISLAAHLREAGARMTGAQPPYAMGGYPGERPSAGDLELEISDSWIAMKTL